MRKFILSSQRTSTHLASHWAAVSLCFALAACGAGEQEADSATEGTKPGKAEKRPNMILVVCDTLRSDRMSLYGHVRKTTPNLDKLAENGTVFENAYSMSSWTLPSMSMLLTGECKGLADSSILTSHFHVAESFSAAGYDTGAVVANPVLNETLHYQRGIDHFDLQRANGMQTRASVVVDKGLEWLDGRADQDVPFFLWLHPVDPHHSYAPDGGPQFDPIPEAEALANTRLSLERDRADFPSNYPKTELTDEAWDRICRERTLYDSEILQFDAAMGELIKSLEARGILDETVIAVTSDHGEGLWDRPRNPDDKETQSFFPALYRRHGLMLENEQTHIPLMFHGPGVPRGERRGLYTPHVDVVPTLQQLCNVPLLKALPGLPLFGETADSGRGPLFSVCARSHSVTVDERWRLHRPRPHRLKKAPVVSELYDLSVDPFERHPIDDPKRVQEFTELIDKWTELYSPIHTMERLTQQQLEALDALGYGGEIELGNLPAAREKKK